jgi:hypothetical protein
MKYYDLTNNIEESTIGINGFVMFPAEMDGEYSGGDRL